jgi:hypothetical protein
MGQGDDTSELILDRHGDDTLLHLWRDALDPIIEAD